MNCSLRSPAFRSQYEKCSGCSCIECKIHALLAEPDGLREYVMGHYLVLYTQIDGNVHLLSIKHHRKLSFDFEAHWSSH